MWNKKSILWELEYWAMLDVRHSVDNMHVKKNVCEATYGRILKNLALGRSSMQRKKRRGQTFPLSQPPSQRQREKNFVRFCKI
jgi:hypothetical protein